MSITQFLDGHKLDPATTRVIGVAYDMTRAALRLADRSDLINEVVAKKMIEAAKAGESDPDQLCEQVMVYFRQHS
jgi:4-hydroxy-3-methylbut-2-enyl diphosphate reductase IspH